MGGETLGLYDQSMPDTAHTAQTTAPVTLSQAFWFWLKLGFISFGGPAGQIAMMHEALVQRHRWISDKRFLHALNYCMLLPGPEAQQLATYIGWLMHKTWGGVIAGVLFVLPSLLMLIGLSWVYVAWGHLPVLAGLFMGIKPAVAALVLQATHRLGSKALKNPWMWGIAAGSFIAIFAFQMSFPLIVALAAGAGWLLGRWHPEAFQMKAGHASVAASEGPAWIDDHSPTPAHARFNGPALVRVILVGLLLWSLPMWALWHGLGLDHAFTQMSWFFTKAAFLTFGGAYAVLPYVYQGAVEQFAWLTPLQMMDGLALGETTPGPLIMVVAFVGFVGAYAHAVLGPDHLFLAGALAAGLVTWFTFLPSFIFILAGGPLVESTHSQLSYTAPLTAITAAVVGVILNLAVFFTSHLLWPLGWGGRFDLASAVMMVLAAWALMRLKINVIWVIALSALAGLGWQQLSLFT